MGAAYSAVQILATAIERAGKADRDAIRDALTKTDMMTVSGPVKFNPDGSAQIITPGAWAGDRGHASRLSRPALSI